MAETIVLDPSEVATSRTQVDLTPWVKGDGIDWGDAEIAAYMADQARGASPVDFRVPNRTVTIPLVLKAAGGTSFATARTTVQAKAALFQREGGWIKRLTSTGGTVFADVVSATLKLGGGWMQAHRSADLDAQLTLDVLPDFYAGEVTLPDRTTTTATELVFTETGILGDYPGRCRIVVDEDDADRQLGLIWGLRSRNYDAATTARLAYNAGTLTPQDAATVVTTTIQHTAVSSMWTPILKTDIIPSGALTHVGTYRIWAQVRSVGTTNRGVDVRLLWDVGDLSTPVINTPKRIPGADPVYTLDLGEVRLDRAKSGTHRWQGQIQAKATTAPADIIVSKVWIAPVDDGYGVLRAPPVAPTSFAAFSARDTFEQTAGNLVGKVAPQGGTWAGSGDAVDFVVEATGDTAQRSELNDTVAAGRMDVLPVSLTNVSVKADFFWTAAAASTAVRSGVVARCAVGGATFVRLYFQPTSSTTAVLALDGPSLNYARVTIPAPSETFTGVAWYSLQLVVFASGTFFGWFGPLGAMPTVPQVVGSHTDLATGGSLATGGVGIYDEYATAAPARTRAYNDLVAYVPDPDAVLHPSQSAELRTEGMFREDAAGVSYAPVPFPTYDYPRLPPAGLEGRTCEVFLKGSRGDLDQLPDTGVDDISARISYRPCWLFVP